jgi:hypothetical protein
LVAFFDQGRFWPNVVCLPQCAHFAMVRVPFLKIIAYREAQQLEPCFLPGSAWRIAVQ